MRPIRLELEGFTAFRDRTVLDFANHELLVLTGPTGSGKSSLIDAMIFALYGSVPRYNDRSAVYPIISQGLQQARVCFDFRVDGVRYTAARVVRRTPGGATTREARLETEGQVLASGAKELSAAIEELLGLSFDQFTTCVVLPQGKFARFLNETPGERQDLLVKLLGLGLFERIGALAGARASHAQVRLDMLQRQLAHSEGLSRERVDAARRQSQALARLAAEAVKLRARWEELRSEQEHKNDEAQTQRGAADRLAALAVPAAAADLAKQLDAADATVAEAEEQVRLRREALEQSRESRSGLGDRTELSLLQARMQRLTQVQREKAEAAEKQLQAKSRHEDAVRATTQAAATLQSAQQQLQQAQTGCQAHALREGLAVGDDCPVCLRPIEALPEHQTPDQLEDARQVESAAQAALLAAQEQLNRASVDVSAGEVRLAELTLQQAGLKDEIKSCANGWTESSLATRLSAIEQADAAVAAAEPLLKDAETRAAAARSTRDQLESARQQARSALAAERDRLGDLGPPALDGEDLAADWDTLLAWARQERPRRSAAAAQHLEAAQSADAQARQLLAGLLEKAAALDLELDDDGVWSGLHDAAGAARAQHEQLEQAYQQRRELKAELKQEKQDHRIAKSLRTHLSARRFERWLLRTAMTQLVTVASATLRELSGGQYSFAFDDMLKFEVIDHHQADERRSARTLSGGETFLASLALALGLTDQISQLASHGAARLDSMFLDEGFGSLDPDTLDVVATAIEELGSRGRMVGLVTHVSDLAERIPVRFAVRKVAGSASLERVA